MKTNIKTLSMTIALFGSMAVYATTTGYQVADSPARGHVHTPAALPQNDIDQEAILKSIESSRLKDYVSSLEKKENTVVGNRGIKVSGGQKQRIGIARALYHNPKILILDEATSSLDTINERKIMEEIYNTAKNITLIIITHRHKSVLNCDKVYLMDNGKIIDEGKYVDLEKRHSF